jgi:hypothetical protein
MLAALDHAVAQFLLEAASPAGVVDTAVHAIVVVAVAAEIDVLEGTAAGVYAVVVAATRLLVYRKAAASDPLLSRPDRVLLGRRSHGIFIDNYDVARSSILVYILGCVVTLISVFTRAGTKGVLVILILHSVLGGIGSVRALTSTISWCILLVRTDLIWQLVLVWIIQVIFPLILSDVV